MMRLRAILRAGVIFGCLLSLILPCPVAADDARKIHVVIVAVPHFAIEDYNNDVVLSSFAERCDGLKTYFQQHLGKDNVDVRQYCTAPLTTRDSLRHLFSVEIPSFSANTLTFIFIMSHGESAQFGNDLLKQDLELITSDTTTSDTPHDSKHEREYSSILFGSELMAWLERAPARSTILIFLDTCHAGSAASVSARLIGFLQQQFGIRTLVIASSLPSDESYRALFTKELLELWNSGECLNQDTLPSDIHDKMKTEAPLEGSEGLPYYVVRYQGPLCLGNFGEDRRLLFLYAGQDAEQNPFQFDVFEQSDGTQKSIFHDKQLSYTYLTIPLDSKKYVINVRRGAQQIGQWPVDLTSSESSLIWFDDSASPDDVGKFGEVMVRTSEENGSSASELAELRQKTVAAYLAANLTVDANRVMGEMSARGESVSFSQDAQSLVFEPSGSVQTFVAANSQSQSASNQSALAKQLELMGDFVNAATILNNAAQNEPDTQRRDEIAKEAYLASIAAGDTDAAKQVQVHYQISVPAPLDLKVAKAPEALKAAGIAAALSSKGPS